MAYSTGTSGATGLIGSANLNSSALKNSNLGSGKTVDDAVNSAQKLKNAGMSQELRKIPLSNNKVNATPSSAGK